MLMVNIKFIREMFTLYPGFSSAGTWGFCVWYLAVGHLLNPVNTAFSRPLEAHSFLPASPRQNTSASSLLEMAWKAFFIFSNLKERFIIRKTRAATPFPEHFLWLFPPGSIWPCLGAVSGWGGGRWGEFQGLLSKRCRKGEEKGPGSLLRDVFGGTCPFHAAVLAHSVAGNAALGLIFPNTQWRLEVAWNA